MKVVLVSTDQKILEKSSQVHQRMIEYGTLVEELHIILISGGALTEERIGRNIFIYTPKAQTRVGKMLNSIRFAKTIEIADLVSAQDPFETGLVGYLLARKLNAKLQLQIHTDIVSPYFIRGSLLNMVRIKIAKILLHKADCIRVVSRKVKEELINIWNINRNKIVVLPIYAGLSSDVHTKSNIDLHERYSQFNFIILMASRLTREKNITLAIESMKEVLIENPKTGLIIVGEGRERDKLEKEASTNKDNIIFEEWARDLYPYYKTADLFLITSKYEGYGMTIVEALRAGLPVVSTNVGIAEEAGAIVTEMTKKDIAKNITKCIQNKTRGRLALVLGTKEEYLDKYKQMLESCL